MTTLSDIDKQAADWIAEFDRLNDQDLWTPARQQALDDWIQASTAHRVAYLRLQQAWRRADRLQGLRRPVHDSRPTRRTAPTWLAAAARSRAWVAGCAMALAMLVAGPIAFWQWSIRGQTIDYSTELGSQRTVALADGSRLTLNTQTTIRSTLSASQRDLRLDQGEVFFEIAHDPSRPFVVHAGKQQVTVLGTKFSLFLDGDRLRVAVLEGRVRVQPDGHAPAVLTHDQIAVAGPSGVQVAQQSHKRVVDGLGWVTGKIVFDQTSLQEAARQFNRYGRTRMVLEDEAAARIAIGGTFDISNMAAFARLLQSGFGLKVTTVGDEIRVSTAP